MVRGAPGSTHTAAGFPANGRLVKASTCTIRMAIILQVSIFETKPAMMESN